ELMEPMLSQTGYAQVKESLASIEWLEKQLRAAINRGDWTRTRELTERIRGIQGSAAAVGEWMKYGEALYDGAADVPMDAFSPGLHVFTGGSPQMLQEWRDRAIEILSSLKRKDDSRKDFYARRESDFGALSIAASADQPEEKKASVTTGQLQREA